LGAGGELPTHTQACCLISRLQDKIAEDPSTHGSAFVPIILGSDKTTVSVATGQNEYYPLYASIGNVSNGVRRAHKNAVALVGFLAIPKSEVETLPDGASLLLLFMNSKSAVRE
jgi:hypothetical protein